MTGAVTIGGRMLDNVGALHTRGTVFAGCLLLASASALHAEQAWKKIADEKEMMTEARSMPGTALREIRVRTHSALPPEAIFSVIWNVAAQHEFVPNVKELRVLKTGEEEVVIYE